MRQRELAATAKSFMLDRPDVSLQELTDHLRSMAEQFLTDASDDYWNGLEVATLVDEKSNLKELAATQALSLDQQKGIRLALEVLTAAQQRVDTGDTSGLIKLIDDDNHTDYSTIGDSTSILKNEQGDRPAVFTQERQPEVTIADQPATRNSLPTPIIAHTLADRSVVVPVRGGKRPEVVTVPSGQEIVVEPIEQAILISEQTKLWDAKASTGFTQGTLQQDAMNICENVVRTINARMVDVLESSKLLKTVELPVLTGSLTAKADTIMDALYESTESSFGAEVSDYGIIAHESQLKALSRLAAKQGFSGEDAIVDMLGTDIAYYNGEDKGVFMLAKRFTALSFGCFRHDGENITVVLSRDGDTQSHSLEILGKVFVVAEAATTVKLDTGAATAVLPVVKRLKFTKTEA